MKWRKNRNETWTSSVGPYLVTLTPTGDGRFRWTIVSSGKPNPEATGMGTSLGAAKTACENFVKRSGHV